MRSTFLWIARTFFSLLFIFGGVRKLMNWQGAVDGLVLTFSGWRMHLEGKIFKENVYELFVSNAHLIMGAAIALKLIGAMLFLLGFRIRLGAVLLLLFMIPATIIIHPFWFNVGSELKQEFFIFLKNLSLIGALFYIALTPISKRSPV